MKRICVYCGSRNGNRTNYAAAATAFGAEMAKQGLDLVYGGASIGIMGTVADSVLKNGGKVIGVLPKMLTQKEIAHAQLTELIIVDSMHTRKTKMFELADAFVALPGGLGTFEELCEILTWSQLGTHRKPCGVFNVDGYYDPLLKMFDTCLEEGFMGVEHRKMILSATNAADMIAQFRSYVPPPLPPWMRESQT